MLWQLTLKPCDIYWDTYEFGCCISACKQHDPEVCAFLHKVLSTPDQANWKAEQGLVHVLLAPAHLGHETVAPAPRGRFGAGTTKIDYAATLNMPCTRMVQLGESYIAERDYAALSC